MIRPHIGDATLYAKFAFFVRLGAYIGTYRWSCHTWCLFLPFSTALHGKRTSY